MSKYKFRDSDIYQPGTDVPVNRLGITDPVVLQEVEAALLTQAYGVFAAELMPDTRFDALYFQTLHHRTWASLYDWAGLYRTQDMVKGSSMFCRAAYLEPESRRIFGELEREGYLHGSGTWPTEQLARRLAYYQGELIALHPFYELNGRITRLFFDLIVMANGYGPIDYSRAVQHDPEVGNTYIRASIHCVQRADQRLLQHLIASGLVRTEK